jgi:hypothetical protein
MIYSIYHNTINDISAYVTDLGAVPIITRNEDYSLVAEGYSFVVSNKIALLEKDDLISFYRNNEMLHLGYISKVTFNEETKTYNITVSHILEKLKSFQTDDDFKILMNAVDTIKNINGQDHEVIHYSSLMAAILSAINITIDWNLWTEKTDYSASGYYHTGTGSGLPPLEGVPAFGETDIFFLPNQILCLNQAKCWHPSYLNTEEGTRNRVNLFDLLSFLFSLTGLVIKIKNDSSVYILNHKEIFSIDDDDILDYEEEGIDPQTKALTLSYTSLKTHTGKIIISGSPPVPSLRHYWFPLNANQAYYYDSSSEYNGDPNDVAEYIYNSTVVTIDDKSVIAWYNNFNAIVLHSFEGTHKCWLVEPVFAGRSFPVMYLGDWKLISYTKVTVQTYASVGLALNLANVLSIKVTDINTDNIEMEYIK